jgi:phosphoribosyl 1,2-cyclic phosphodiesterase
MIVAPLCSSSSANSTFIGNKSKYGGVLIDIGCSYKALREQMGLCGLDVSNISAVLITHEHTDHIKGLKVFTKNNLNTPVFASRGTRHFLLEKEHVHNPEMLFDVSEISNLVDFDITAFSTSHDAAESVGFTITCNSGYKIAYMTDLGMITPQVRQATLGADFAFIESNYDYDMLWGGNYHYHVKQRIGSDSGHLSNTDCADYILELTQKGCTRMVLAHLSRENNTPRTAYQNTVNRLARGGAVLNRDFTLNVAGALTKGEVIAI